MNITQYCNIRGIWLNHIYYPTTPPSNFENNTTYDIFVLPNRIYEEWQQRLEKIHKSKVGKMRDTLVNKYGKGDFNIFNCLIYFLS